MQTSGPTTGRKAVGRLARLQGGCVARWQLRFLGLNGATLSRLVHRDGWGVVHGGVYRLPGVLEGPLSGRRRDALVHGIDWTVARYPVAMIDASPTEFADRYRRRLQDELDAFY